MHSPDAYSLFFCSQTENQHRVSFWSEKDALITIFLEGLEVGSEDQQVSLCGVLAQLCFKSKDPKNWQRGKLEVFMAKNNLLLHLLFSISQQACQEKKRHRNSGPLCEWGAVTVVICYALRQHNTKG